MANLTVQYQRANYALMTLTKEISALWGYPARPYEFVSGYKSGENYSGHNADANGVAHGVDIFVGGGSLTETQANTLTAFLRNEGLKGDIPGHPDRLYYIIYRDRIAGDFSNWEWVGAGYGHWDHIHISTCDVFWGDPAPISSLDYDSTAPWGLSSNINAQSNRPTPIKPIQKPLGGFLMALTDNQQTDLYNKVNELHRDYIQGVPGRNSDGDSFNFIRRIAGKLGVGNNAVSETARRKKVTGK